MPKSTVVHRLLNTSSTHLKTFNSYTNALHSSHEVLNEEREELERFFFLRCDILTDTMYPSTSQRVSHQPAATGTVHTAAVLRCFCVPLCEGEDIFQAMSFFTADQQQKKTPNTVKQFK